MSDYEYNPRDHSLQSRPLRLSVLAPASFAPGMPAGKAHLSPGPYAPHGMLLTDRLNQSPLHAPTGRLGARW